MKYFKTVFVFSLLLFSAGKLFPLDILSIFRNPEIADRNSLFLDIGIAPLSLKDFDWDIQLIPLNIRADYMLPIDLPISVGVFVITPNPNLKHFGVRAAYHFDIFDSLTDFYLVYCFDLGFFRNELLIKFNDTPVPVHFFDFRAGIRRFFRSRIGVSVETGFKFDSLTISVSLKIN